MLKRLFCFFTILFNTSLCYSQTGKDSAGVYNDRITPDDFWRKGIYIITNNQPDQLYDFDSFKTYDTLNHLKPDIIFIYHSAHLKIFANSLRPIIINHYKSSFLYQENPQTVHLMQEKKFDSIYFNGSYANVYVLNSFDMYHDTPNWDSAKIFLLNTKIDTLKSFINTINFVADNSVFGYIYLKGTKTIGHFILKNCKIDGASFEDTELPDTISLLDLTLSKIKEPIDVTRIPNKHLYISISNTDLTKFKIPYDKVDFLVGKDQTFEQASILYQQILQQLSLAGLTEKYEKYDKRFKELKYQHSHLQLINLIDKYWWDYGYQRGRVVWISFILWVLFCGINIIFRRYLIEIYWPESFKRFEIDLNNNHLSANGISKKGERIFSTAMILYTAYIFWGIKLDLRELHINNKWALALILFEYVSGIICLAYIANYIITK